MLVLTINVTLFYAAPLLYIIINKKSQMYYINNSENISRHMHFICGSK